MTQEEMREEFYALYNMMANSNKVENMHTFGRVQKEMFEWFVANKTSEAEEFLNKLESIRWRNYLTPKEAQKIVDGMIPKAPWTRDVWKSAMEQHGYALGSEPCYNSCALWVVMSMIMSDSSETLGKFVDKDSLFDLVYHLAVDKLTDEDGMFDVRAYFHL